MRFATVGPIDPAPADFAHAAREAAARLGQPAKLALAYLPFDADHAALLAPLNALGAPVVGATHGGAAFTERGVTRGGAVAALIAGDDLDVTVALARDLRAPGAVAEAVSRLKLESGRETSLLTLADPFAGDGEALVAALRESAPANCRHFGGTAGDSWSFQAPRVLFGGEALTGAGAFVGLTTREAPVLAVHHGWNAAGRQMTVTSAEGHVLRSLDGRPALQVYREELEELGLVRPGELVQRLATYALGVRTAFGDQLKIRTPMRINPDQSITLAGAILEGEIVRVVSTSPDRLIDSARLLASRALADRPDTAGALVFDCAGRLQLLEDRYPEQARAFLGGRSFPLVGFATYGEIATSAGVVDGFHNTTAVMVAF